MFMLVFRGGVDSTVLLHLVRQIYPDVKAVYCDTGLEYPEIKNFVKSCTNVEIIRPELSFKEVIKTYGYPIVSKEVANKVSEVKKNNGYNTRTGKRTVYWLEFQGLRRGKNGLSSMYNKKKWKFLLDTDFKISGKCCDILKKRPFKLYEKKTGLKPYLGILAEESIQRRNEWITHGCNAFDGDRPRSRPLSIWTRSDELEYITRYKIPYCKEIYGDIVEENEVYDTTLAKRTGCVYCGFGVHLEKEPNRFQKLKISHPKIWEYCMKPEEEGGLGMKKVMDFLGVPVE